MRHETWNLTDTLLSPHVFHRVFNEFIWDKITQIRGGLLEIALKNKQIMWIGAQESGSRSYSEQSSAQWLCRTVLD